MKDADREMLKWAKIAVFVALAVGSIQIVLSVMQVGSYAWESVVGASVLGIIVGFFARAIFSIALRLQGDKAKKRKDAKSDLLKAEGLLAYERDQNRRLEDHCTRLESSLRARERELKELNSRISALTQEHEDLKAKYELEKARAEAFEKLAFGK